MEPQRPGVARFDTGHHYMPFERDAAVNRVSISVRPTPSIFNLTSHETFGMKMLTFLVRTLDRKFVGRPSRPMVRFTK
jgi:hypothetical protein